jgi:hypothetical protein
MRSLETEMRSVAEQIEADAESLSPKAFTEKRLIAIAGNIITFAKHGIDSPIAQIGLTSACLAMSRYLADYYGGDNGPPQEDD